MYVCFLWYVFDRQVLVIGCTLGGALYRYISGGVDAHCFFSFVVVFSGGGEGEEVFFFQVLVESKFSSMYF